MEWLIFIGAIAYVWFKIGVLATILSTYNFNKRK